MLLPFSSSQSNSIRRKRSLTPKRSTSTTAALSLVPLLIMMVRSANILVSCSSPTSTKVTTRMFSSFGGVTTAFAFQPPTTSTSHQFTSRYDSRRNKRNNRIHNLHTTIEKQKVVLPVPFHYPHSRLFLSSSTVTTASTTTTENKKTRPSSSSSSLDAASIRPFKVNLLTIPLSELKTLLQSWGQPAYRASQIQHWVREKGVTSAEEMSNLPVALRTLLSQHCTLGSADGGLGGGGGNLELAFQQTSKDGTVKRAYKLFDGQLIESVLMPYTDGRNTACISSQAGCAMGCVFCATGQMGFARQLSTDEIFEQVARFASELKAQGGGQRLSNVVFMGMGEPMANYKHVMAAITRMNTELGIGARRITVSTVGVVPAIRRLIDAPVQVKLAVSLHCAEDAERTKLMPANQRYGGLGALMEAVKDYTSQTNRRMTFEWALIEFQNDSPEVARKLGRLIIHTHKIPSYLVHVNVIPLNPTGGFTTGEDGHKARPSGKKRVDRFVEVLYKEFGISATPRVRRGIDIDAGCGQLKSKVNRHEEKKKKEEEEAAAAVVSPTTALAELQEFATMKNANANMEMTTPIVGVYEDEEEEDTVTATTTVVHNDVDSTKTEEGPIVTRTTILDPDFADDDFGDEEETSEERSSPQVNPALMTRNAETKKKDPHSRKEPPASSAEDLSRTTTEERIRETKKRRKKLLKNLKAIRRLRDKDSSGGTLNEEQRTKLTKEESWRVELETVEHSLQNIA